MTREPGLPPDPTVLSHRSAIAELLSSHSRGLDRLDAQLLRACYWPDASVDYGSFRGPATQFVELVIPALRDGYQLTRHDLCNTLVRIDGTRAVAESCVIAAHLLPAGDAELVFRGRYLDTLEQREGRWKLLQRTVVMDWCRRGAVQDERDSEAFGALAKGARGEDDPLYNLLGGATP